MSEAVIVRPVTQMSNEEFLRTYAKPGRIGLAGGLATIDRGIRGAQRGITTTGHSSLWSHAFVFQGVRADGHQWVVESDLDAGRGFVRLGVQENRIAKFFDETKYGNLAVLDFGLDDARTQAVLGAALDLVAEGTRYAIGGVFHTASALLRKQVWKERKKESTFCSQLVRAVYDRVDIDLTPGVAVRHTTPEHLAQCELPHVRWTVVRDE